MEPGSEPIISKSVAVWGEGTALSWEPGVQVWGVVLLLPACAGTSPALYGSQSPHQKTRAVDQMLSGVPADS